MTAEACLYAAPGFTTAAVTANDPPNLTLHELVINAAPLITDGS